jgi:radical SAM superfamily enzyme YgiQ (UPF0313 family)
MKVAISYPPLESGKGVPLLSQNRQFQWFNNPTYIYPVIPAYAATLLKANGYDVMWDDGIAEELTYREWFERILHEQPDIIAVETKTPVIKRHWKIIDELKTCNPKILTVLMGDHVTALPQESLLNCKVDYVIASGDYDFMLLNLSNHLSQNRQLEGGFWFRENSRVVSSGNADLSGHDLNSLPFIDRELTKWRLYAYRNGNFKYTPGTYIMSGRDCWWGQCSFCSWTTTFPGAQFRIRSPEKAVEEIGSLIRLGVKEIMEDSGTLPVGQWLKDFCEDIIQRGYNKKTSISCNMRITGIKDPDMWRLMKKAGFRLILFGLESANQTTLDRINKNLNVQDIEPNLRMCKEAGLEPHITAMIGYPWETKEMTQNTINLARSLFKKGYVDTLQATIVIPYPGTPLYDECNRNGWLLTDDWDDFDQRKAVMKTLLTEDDIKEFTQGLYKSFVNMRFITRKIFGIRSWTDIKYLIKAGSKVMGHLTDFSPRKNKC